MIKTYLDNWDNASDETKALMEKELDYMFRNFIFRSSHDMELLINLVKYAHCLGKGEGQKEVFTEVRKIWPTPL